MIRKLSIVSCLAVAVALPVRQADAFQLTNRDPEEQKITVFENNASQEAVVKPSQMVDQICKTGCTVKMPNGQEYDFNGNETVSIMEGLLFLDEPASGAAEPPKP